MLVIEASFRLDKMTSSRTGTMHTPSSFGRNSWFFVAVCALALHLPMASGCGPTGESVTDALALAALPPAREELMGQQMKQKLTEEQNISLLPEDEQFEGVHGYVETLGQKAVENGNKIDTSTDSSFDNTTSSAVYNQIDFNFHVIDAPNTVNAFAMAGGEIYVYSGLLLEADSEAEVMAVMSHEVAHVTERHVAKQMLAAYGTKFAAEKAAEKLGDAANGQADEIIDFFVKRIATKGVIAAYGRKQETDADTKGVAYMSEAGYDPNGFIDFFQKLQGQGPQGVQLFSSHPPPKNRIESVRKLINKEGYSGQTVGKEDHENVKKSLNP